VTAVGALGLVLNAIVRCDTRYFDAAPTQLPCNGHPVADIERL